MSVPPGTVADISSMGGIPLIAQYRGLDGEATECRLCKHCGCMLNTDYI